MTTSAAKFTETGIVYTVEAEAEDAPIEGNASAIDEETDRETEEWIRSQLDAGNEWAWATVKVTASFPGLEIEGVAYLGCCSYRSREDFMEPGGYYDDLKDEAKEDLLRQVEALRAVICGATP
jgi:hypothetical protein